MSWKLELSYFESYSCGAVCPCTASVALSAAHERCRGNAGLYGERRSGGWRDVSGLRVAVVNPEKQSGSSALSDAA